MKASTKIFSSKESSQEIKKQVEHLLKAAGVGDKLPTPKEDIIACSKLVEIGQLDLSKYEDSWIKKGFNILKNALSKIKGLLDFKQEIIYVDPNIHYAQKTFLTYHEVSHRIFPWHEGLFNPHIDTEYSIEPKFAIGLEAEANIGASLIQFQIDRFKNELRNFPLGLGSALELAKRYETSLHSTFRKYVEDNHQACALLVLKAISDDDLNEGPVPLELWYPLQSQKFTKEYGMVDWEKFYYPGHTIYDTIFSNLLQPIKSGEMELNDLLGFKRKCKIEVFCNKFNHFILLYPIPRFISRKKIIIGNTNV